MIGAVLAEVKGLVDRRFLLTAFFPVLVFLLIVGMLYAEINGGMGLWVKRWETLSGGAQVLAAVAVLAGTFLAASFVSSNGILLIRLYEGYFFGRRLWTRGVDRQKARKARLTADVELYYPHDDLRPTALGNVLSAAETYPRRAYGINALVVWPRLYVLVPDKLASASGPLDTVQFLCLVSLLSTVLAVGGGAYAAFEGLGAAIYLGLVAGGLVVARLAYSGAVEAGVEYGLHLRAAFDLYRNELLVQLGRPLPATQEEEKRTWADVSQRLSTGEQWPLRYVRKASS